MRSTPIRGVSGSMSSDCRGPTAPLATQATKPRVSACETADFIEQAIASHWKLCLLCAVVVALYVQILGRLVLQWFQDPNYGHGFFVPLFAGYVIWQKRQKLKSVVHKPSGFGLMIVFFSLFLLFLGSLGAELFLTRISLLGVISGLIVYFAGWPALRVLTFPLLFLALMVPLPAIVYNQIVFPLQLLASGLSTACIQQSALVPVLREGNLLVLPNYTLEVVDACSGIRSLMSLITLGIAYGYLVERNWIVRTFLALAMVPIAVFANAARVMFTALLVTLWGPGAAEGTWHSLAALVIFLFATVALLSLHALTRFISRHSRQNFI
jgi:exosortase